MNHAWEFQAACRNVPENFWFPGRGESIEPAMLYCRSCPVRVNCMQEALDQHINVGIYGSSDRQRRTIRKLGLTAEQALEQGLGG